MSSFITRRRFLTGAATTLSTLLLSGCDRLSRTQWFPQLLSSAEALNHQAHNWITRDHALAKEFTEADISPVFPSNGTSNPKQPQYQALARNGFSDWRLEVGGLVQQPISLSLMDIRALPSRTQITRHDCVEGWSAIAKWKGAKLSALLERVRPLPVAKYVVFYCADQMDEAGHAYYESVALKDAFHPQTILAYEWNGVLLPIRYGAPIRLRLERQLGYKMAKYVMRIQLVESFESIAGGKGGFWEDRGYEWYAGI